VVDFVNPVQVNSLRALTALFIPAAAINAVCLIMLLLDAGIESLYEMNEG